MQHAAAASTLPRVRTYGTEDFEMSKVIFVIQRRPDLTREQCLAEWSGDRHVSVLKELPGLTEWRQNHVTGDSGESICDGIGELWFADDDALNAALDSPQMGAAVEDAKSFLDMERTGMVIVDEKTIIR
jgi:uncharacterized protein (TIGR02118 family)